MNKSREPLDTWPFYGGRKHHARLVNGVGIIQDDLDQIVCAFIVEPFELIAGSTDIAIMAQRRLI